MPRTRRSTGAATNTWPPASSDDDDGKQVVVLAEEIYWEHVRPFIRTCDLKCLSHRCSTRFAPAACQRCDIGEVCTTEFIRRGRGWQILASPKKSRGRKRRRRVLNSVLWSFTKNPGSPDFISSFESRLEMNAADCAPSYAEARSKWDAHMAATLSPNCRLVESIDMVLTMMKREGCDNLSLPRLFLALFPCYDGSFSSIIEHHKRTNPASLSASLLCGEDFRWINGICLKVSYPVMTLGGLWCFVTVHRALSTPLCYYVGLWFYQEEFLNEDDAYSEIFDAIESLLDAGADASCFAHCLLDLEVDTWQESPDRFNGLKDKSYRQFYMFEFDENKNWFCGRRRDAVPLLRLMKEAADVFAQSPEYYAGKMIYKVYNKLAMHIDPALLESKGLDTSLPEIQEPTTFVYDLASAFSTS